MFCPPEGIVSVNVNRQAMMFSEEKHTNSNPSSSSSLLGCSVYRWALKLLVVAWYASLVIHILHITLSLVVIFPCSEVAPHVTFRMVWDVDFELLRRSCCRLWYSHCSGIQNRC